MAILTPKAPNYAEQLVLYTDPDTCPTDALIPVPLADEPAFVSWQLCRCCLRSGALANPGRFEITWPTLFVRPCARISSMSGAAIARIGIRGREDGHVATWSSKRCVELVGVMHPGLWQPFHDGMRAVACRHQKRKPRAVGAGAAGRVVRRQLPILYIPERS